LGPFANIPNAAGNGAAYVMVYMSMSSVILWGVGMPWFKRRNQQKIEREKVKNVELEHHAENAVGKEGLEKQEVQAHAHPVEVHHDLSKVGLLLHAAEEGGAENPDAYSPHIPTLKGKVLKIISLIRKSYLFEVLTLPPVLALLSSLFISFIPPLRKFLMTTYAQVIPNTATFIGDASIPIILMFLGSNLADTSKDAYVPKKITFSVVVTRLVVLPTIGISIVYGLIRLNVLPNDVVLQFLVMIQFAMPSAVNLILACQVAGGGEAKMSSLLFWQYVFCSFTISFFCIIVQYILL